MCEHKWKAIANTRGIWPNEQITGYTVVCEKCGERQKSELDEKWEAWEHWVTRNGDYR